MNKVEEKHHTLTMTEMNRFVSSNMRSLEEKNEAVTVTRHNKPFAVIIPVKAYSDLLEKALPQPESDPRPPSSAITHKAERESLPPYPEITLRLPMDGSKDWGHRQLGVLMNTLLELNNAKKVATDGDCSDSVSGGCQ